MARLRILGYIVLNTVMALVGPAVLSSSLPQFHPHTGLGIIWRVWITSIIYAGFFGIVAVRMVLFRTDSSSSSPSYLRIPGDAARTS